MNVPVVVGLQQPFGVKITLTVRYECALCSSCEEIKWDIPNGAELPRIDLPGAWKLMDYMTICPRHPVRYEGVEK